LLSVLAVLVLAAVLFEEFDKCTLLSR